MTPQGAGLEAAVAGVLLLAALVGLAVGLRIQDRFRQSTFDRAIRAFLLLSATGLLLRGLRDLGLHPW